jgi:hypothetical protein
MSETAVVKEHCRTAEVPAPSALRIEHWVQFASFTILALACPKFNDSDLQEFHRPVGRDRGRSNHIAAATILMVAVVYHIGAVLYRLYVKRYQPSMLPTMIDVRSGIRRCDTTPAGPATGRSRTYTLKKSRILSLCREP